MFGVDSILGTRSSGDDDFYKILGCDETASVDQISTEYKIRALKYHPDKNIGDEGALETFQKLQEARDILTDPEKRSKYDQWKSSGICMPYKQWLGLSSRCQMVKTMHWSNPKMGLMLEPEQDRNHTNGNLDVQPHPPEGLHKAASTSRIFGEEPLIKLEKPRNWKPDRVGVYSKFRNYEI